MTARFQIALVASMLAAGVAYSAPAKADAVADFYKDKQVRFIVPTETGGGYDLYMRTLVQYMPSHMPGHPTAVIVNMAGAGGVKATNYAYNAAARDGTVVFMPFFNHPLFQLIKPEGIRFDVRKMPWLGNMAELNSVVAVMATSPIKTIEDAKKHEVILAASAKGSETYFYPQLANALLGTRFKMVMGYPGTAAMSVAMERGEVQGRGGAWETWPATRPEWVKEGKIRVLIQAGLRRDPDLKDVPLITELAADADKPLARLISSAVVTARMVGMPPAVPEDRVKALRQAFDATMKDPAFQADAKRRKMTLQVMTGEQVEALIADLFKTPPDVVARAKKTLGY